MKLKLTIIAAVTLMLMSCNDEKKSNSDTSTDNSEASSENVNKSNQEITERYWYLKTLNGKAISKADNQKQAIRFALKKQDQNVTGFTGCNSISGLYDLGEGNRIHFKNMAVTLKACLDVPINESEFLKVFELANNYTINNNVLSLNVGKRAPLAVFETADVD